MSNPHTSTCSAASEDSQLPLAGLDTEPLPSASKTITAAKSSSDTGPMCQSSRTSETLTAASGAEPDCSQEDFLANLSVKPGSDEARKMTVTSGLKCSALLKKQDPISCLQRMLLASSTWHSTMFFLNWKAKGTPQGRLYFQLAPSMPRTDETGYGLWRTPLGTDGAKSGHGNLPHQVKHLYPTPTTQEIEHPQAELTATGRRKTKDGTNSHSLNLADTVQQQTWPTPNASDNRDRGNLLSPSIQRRQRLGKQLNLSMVVSEVSGSLNPQWVEWLMGYPSGWTDLKPSETPSSHK